VSAEVELRMLEGSELVLGWVVTTDKRKKTSRYVTNHPNQLNLANPPEIGSVSNSKD